MFATIVLAFALQGPAHHQPPSHNPGPLPPGHNHRDWHSWHQFRGLSVEKVFARYGVMPLVITHGIDQAYVQVDAAGNVVQTFRLVPVEAAPVVVSPPVYVVPEQRRSFWRWRR